MFAYNSGLSTSNGANLKKYQKNKNKIKIKNHYHYYYYYYSNT